MEKKKFKEFDAGNVCIWIEQDSSIMLKASDGAYNDPVELSGNQAREIANYLNSLAKKLDVDHE